MKQQVSILAARIGAALRSRRGKNVLLYLLFLAVAFVFWIFMSLDTERQRDFELPLELQEVPDSVTLIGQMPQTLAVSVKGKDSQLLRYSWGKQSTIKFKWNENASDDILLISHTRLETRLRDYFGANVQIASFRPDSIRISYTTQPGVKVSLNIQADIHPNLQYIVSGPIKANVDSVTLYSATDIPHSLRMVSTEPLVKSGLKDTARFEVKVKPIDGIRIIPDKVTVTVPIEPLISRKRAVRIETFNVPDGKSLVTFPSMIEVSYLVPMSSYNDDYPIKAFVDYNDTRLPGNKIPVSLSAIPSLYRNVSKSIDNVEYIIENE
ncbi:MAG: YbbR-like domain-containing protein [Muribaculaceae bacterium]|nr:YbbR-like domain-containing protein [Muribaculaceae bacterium]